MGRVPRARARGPPPSHRAPLLSNPHLTWRFLKLPSRKHMRSSPSSTLRYTASAVESVLPRRRSVCAAIRVPYRRGDDAVDRQRGDERGRHAERGKRGAQGELRAEQDHREPPITEIPTAGACFYDVIHNSGRERGHSRARRDRGDDGGRGRARARRRCRLRAKCRLRTRREHVVEGDHGGQQRSIGVRVEGRCDRRCRTAPARGRCALSGSSPAPLDALASSRLFRLPLVRPQPPPSRTTRHGPTQTPKRGGVRVQSQRAINAPNQT